MMLKENDKEDQQDICRAPSPDTQRHDNSEHDMDPIGSHRVYKKTSSNQMLTLYLGSREIISRKGTVEPLKGVVFIDPKIINSSVKIYGQLTLTFRYGREDEEVMGLKFCNEAVIALQQIWPLANNEDIDDITKQKKDKLTPLQEALLDRLGKNSVPFTIEINTIAPPSVQLLPAKRYIGAPIGTSYDVRVYTAETTADERIQRRSTVRLGVRLIHKINPESNLTTQVTDSSTATNANPPSLSSVMPKTFRLKLSPKTLKLTKHQSCSVDSSANGSIKSLIVKDNDGVDFNKGPEGSVDKPFLWAEGRVSLRASLNKSAYIHGEHITVSIDVRNDSRKMVRKIRIFAIQHVDVCMFSNGKFKNIVAEAEINKQILSGDSSHGSYSLLPVRGTTKNWIAVEGALFTNTSCVDSTSLLTNSKLASTAPRGAPQAEDKNVFAIYVSYYIKIKLQLSGMGGEMTLKLPFILGNVELAEDNRKPYSKATEIPEETDTNICSGSTSVQRKSSAVDDNFEETSDCLIEKIGNGSTKAKSQTQSNRIAIFKNSKIPETFNISNSVEVITEELKNLQNNSNKIVRSESSKSNLNDDICSPENHVIEAQVHCH